MRFMFVPFSYSGGTRPDRGVLESLRKAAAVIVVAYKATRVLREIGCSLPV